MPSALDEFTVVDLTTGEAGALCTMFLSEHGARVVRVVGADAPDFREGGFVIWDRGKECVRIDLGTVDPARPTNNQATGAFVRLITAADILVEDYAPSDAAQRYVDYDWLRQLNPRLVACSITAYGKRGPWKDEPPIDELVLARMGVLASMSGFRPGPVHVVHPLPTVGASILAALGIASALYACEESGVGRQVETSLMSGAILYHPKVAGENLAPYTFPSNPSGSAAFYANYECADGNWVQLGCVHPGFVAVAATLMGIGELLEEPRFEQGRPQDPETEVELRALVAGIVRKKSYAIWAREFEEADVPFAPARWTEESFDDPQINHNEMVIELDDPVHGPVTQMGVGLKLSETPGRVKGPRQAATEIDDLAERAAAPRTESPRSDSSSGAAAPPLAGVRVLEITNLIAGPTAGRLLADLGADVIKIEPPSGDISRPLGRTYFYGVNFNKRSVCVNTRPPEGKNIVQRIGKSADILLANLRPGATERMGLGPALNPELIEVHLTGYGWTGPYSKRPGIDPLASAYLGLLRAQGGRENPPVFPAELAPTDYTTGAVGTLGAVLCLLTRKRSGVVQRAESNLLNGGILLCSQWFSRYEGRADRPLADKEQFGLSPSHRLFKVADGWIYVAADSEQEQRALSEQFACELEALPERMSALTVAESLQRLRRAGIPAAPVLAGDSHTFVEAAHPIENNMVADREHPTAGAMRVSWNLIQFGNSDVSIGRPTPTLGQHSREVLEELGQQQSEIDSLYADGVIH